MMRHSRDSLYFRDFRIIVHIVENIFIHSRCLMGTKCMECTKLGGSRGTINIAI